jgi:hypothetical protein
MTSNHYPLLNQSINTYSFRYKKEMAQEFLVADLASPDHGIGVLNAAAAAANEAAAAGGGGGGSGSGGLAGEDANNTKILSQTYSSMVQSASISSSSSGESGAASAPAIVSDDHRMQMDRLDEEIGLVSVGGSGSSESGVSPSAPELSHAQRKELAKYGLI